MICELIDEWMNATDPDGGRDIDDRADTAAVGGAQRPEGTRVDVKRLIALVPLLGAQSSEFVRDVIDFLRALLPDRPDPDDGLDQDADANDVAADLRAAS